MTTTHMNNQIGMVSPLVVIIITLVSGVGIFFAMKNSDFVQPTPTNSAETAQREQPDPYRLPTRHDNDVATVDEENNIVQFRGTITGHDYGCYADAVCSFETDRGTIILNPGRTMQTYTTIGTWEEQSIGTQVEVQAIVDPQEDNRYLLFSLDDLDTELYVREVTTSTSAPTQPALGQYGADDTFRLSVGERVAIDGGYMILLDRLETVSSCGSDVVNCPDDIIIGLYQEDGAFIKEFKLVPFNYPYKIDSLDLSVINKMGDQTFEFKLSPTRF